MGRPCEAASVLRRRRRCCPPLFTFMAQPRDRLKAAIEALLVQVGEGQRGAARAGRAHRRAPTIPAPPQIDAVDASLASFNSDADQLATQM